MQKKKIAKKKTAKKPAKKKIAKAAAKKKRPSPQRFGIGGGHHR